MMIDHGMLVLERILGINSSSLITLYVVKHLWRGGTCLRSLEPETQTLSATEWAVLLFWVNDTLCFLKTLETRSFGGDICP